MSTLGDTLRDERRRAGKTLVDMEAGTNIRGKLLEALENGEHDKLPSRAYVKGFIVSYARCLDIPSEPLIELYEKEADTRSHPKPRISVAPDTEVPRRHEQHALPWRTALIIAAVVVGVGITLWAVGRLISEPEARGPDPLPVSAEDTAVLEPVEATASAVASVPGVVDAPDPATEPEAPASEPFELEVSVGKGEASWLVVKVDGLTAYRGTLTDGRSKSWTVEREASVAMGRPSAVTILRDGEKVTDKYVVIARVPTVVLTSP